MASPDTAESESSADRSASQQVLHDDVKAALFTDASTPRRAKNEDFETGLVLAGRYRIVGLIGRGGMGEVYRARDLVLDADVAIKFIPRRWAGDESFMARFVQEVKLARQVTHANVCRVHDLGEVDGRRFLSMEFIDGENLGLLLRRIGRLPFEKAMELAQQLCAGLAALHEQGVLHRDLKPENIMLDGNGRLKITDFGLAAAEAELNVTQRREGTPAYMAPEQRDGAEISVRTDLYALGLVLYELLSGKHAFSGVSRATGASTLTARDGSTPVPDAIAGVPPEVSEVIAQCLEAEPISRPQSAFAVALRLPGGDPVAAALAAGRTPSVDALVRSGSHERLPRQWGLGVAAVAALAMLIAVITTPFISMLGRAGPDSPPSVIEHDALQMLGKEVVSAESLSFVHREFEAEDDLLSWLKKTGRDVADGPSPYLVSIRTQPTAFRPRTSISMHDPAWDVPGAVRVVVDGDGLLRSMMVVSAPNAQGAGEAFDWTQLLEHAGLEPEALAAVEPTLVPPVFADRRVAFQGHSKHHDANVRVEAASRGGEAVAFELIGEWDDRFAADQTEVSDDPQADLSAYFVIPGLGFLLVLLVIGVRRTMARGDADAAGARRIGWFLIILMTAMRLLRRDTIMGESMVLGHQMFIVIGIVVVIASYYYALEPLCRRHLPGAMASWARLLRGRFADPLVARDILFGVLFAAVFTAASNGAALGLALPPSLRVRTPDDPLSTIGAVLDAMALTPQVFFFVVLLVRVLGLRIGRIVFIATVMLLPLLIVESPNKVALVLSGVMWGIVIVRFGLLTAISYSVARGLLGDCPITFDMSVWYFWTGAVAVAVCALLLAYGVRYGVAASGEGHAAGARTLSPRG